jgi:uncharacterized phiE125 gp8 family phage protein
MSLRVITPPAAEPVSIETVKQHLRIDHDLEDFLLTAYIKAAREQAEELTRRALITQTLEQSFNAFPADGILPLWRPPLQSVTSVTYYDSLNASSVWTDYFTDINSEPGVIQFKTMPGAALRASGGVVVRFVAGYGTAGANVPERINQSILQLIGHWYENREGMNVPDAIRTAFWRERVVWI